MKRDPVRSPALGGSWLVAALLVAAAALALVVWAPVGGVVRILVPLALLALLVWLTASSNRDRRRDEEAREEFDRTGHWPGD